MPADHLERTDCGKHLTASGLPTAGADSLPHGEAVVSQRLAKVLQQFRGREIVLIRPGGNHGDQLIYYGMHRLMERLGLPYRELTYKQFTGYSSSPSEVLYIHGGGGYTPWWSGRAAKCFQQAISQHRGAVIVGPTTFYDDEQYLHEVLIRPLRERRATELFVYARERYSHAVLQKLVGAEFTLDLDHDTAFNLQSEELWNLVSRRKRWTYILYALRQDAEQTEHSVQSPFVVRLDPVRSSHTFDQWLRIHANASTVITNRLHSAIACSVLGLPTTLLANNYHKNRGVWEYSLAERGVQWADELKTKQLNVWNRLSHAAARTIQMHRWYPSLRVR